MGMMTDTDLLVCEVAAKGVGWAAGRLHVAVGEAADRIIGGLCQEKYDKDRLFNDQLKYCHVVAESSGDNAAKNTALQNALLDLVELFAVTGNTASKSMFRALYLQKRAPVWGWAEWYPYKWKNIKTNREPKK